MKLQPLLGQSLGLINIGARKATLWVFGLLFFWHLYAPAAIAHPQQITIAFSLENYDFSQFFGEFTGQTGIDVGFAKVSTSDMKMEVLTMADRRSLPDAIIIPGDMLGLDVAAYSEVPDAWITSGLEQDKKALGMVDGQLVGIPLIAGNHLVLYYNKSLVEAPAKTWDALIRQRNRLPAGRQLIGWSYNEMFWLIPFLGAFDAFPYQQGQVNLKSPGTVSAFEFYLGLANKSIVQPQCNYQCAFDKFVAGNLAYTINGSWSYGAFAEVLGEDLGVLTLPSIEGREMVPYSSVHALAFPNQSLQGEKRAQLKLLAEFLQSAPVQRRIWQELRGLPVSRQVMAEVKAGADANLAMLIEQLDRSEPMPNAATMAIVWEALLMGFSRFQGGAMDAKQAGEYMQYIAEKSGKELR